MYIFIYINIYKYIYIYIYIYIYYYVKFYTLNTLPNVSLNDNCDTNIFVLIIIIYNSMTLKPIPINVYIGHYFALIFNNCFIFQPTFNISKTLIYIYFYNISI